MRVNCNGKSANRRHMMKHVAGKLATGVAAAVCVSAAVDPAGPDRSWRVKLRKPSMTHAARDSAAASVPVAGLPGANGRSFATLDAYLAHLRAYGATIDRPWYREVRPDVFQLERGNLRTLTAPPTFTREQLERRFGFRR